MSKIVSKPYSKEGQDNYDKIFRKDSDKSVKSKQISSGKLKGKSND